MTKTVQAFVSLLLITTNIFAVEVLLSDTIEYTFGNSKNTYHYTPTGLLDSVHTIFDTGENYQKYYYSDTGELDSIITTDLDKDFDNWKEFFVYDNQGRKIVDSSNSGNILSNTYKVVEVCHTTYLDGKTIDTLFNYETSQTDPYVRKVETTTLDADGDPVSANTDWYGGDNNQITYSYIEKNGKKLLDKIESTGGFIYTITYTYNDAGQKIEEKVRQKNGNDWIDVKITSTYGELITPVVNKQSLKEQQVLEVSSLSSKGTISINASQDGYLSGGIYTASGRLVSPINHKSIKNGMNTVHFGEVGTLSAGAYLVRITLNGSQFSKLIQAQ